MALARVDYNKIIPLFREIKIYLLNDRLRGIFKIDRDHAADGARHLVEKPRRFVPVNIFGILSASRVCNGVDLPVVVECVQHGAYQHFKRSGTADARGADNGRCDAGVETSDLETEILQRFRYALYQTDRTSFAGDLFKI